MKYHNYIGKSQKELDKIPSFTEFSAIKTEQSGADKYLGAKENGIIFSFLNGNKLTQIDFYSEGYKGFSQFSKKLPKNLRFDMSQKDIWERLGTPEHTQASKEIPIIGHIPAADSFNFDTYRIMIRYSQDLSSILLITLTSEMN